MEYRLAQSGDASCNGLTNPEEGSRVLRFMKSMKLIEQKLFINEELKFNKTDQILFKSYS